MTDTTSITIIAAPQGYWHGLALALGLLVLIAVLVWFWNRRHFQLWMAIATTIMLVGCIGVLAYSGYLLSSPQRLAAQMEELVTTVEKEFPGLQASSWQHELKRLADNVNGLPYLAIVALEANRGTIVTAYPSHLVGKTVDEGDLPGPTTDIQKYIHGQLFKQVVFPAELDRSDYSLTTMDQKPLQVDLAPDQASTWIMWAHYVPSGQLAPWAGVTGIVSGSIPVFLIAYWASIVAWVYHDNKRRGTARFAWTFLVLITNVVALLVYLIVRQSGRDQVTEEQRGEKAE